MMRADTHRSFYHPRYWLTWCSLAILYLISRLSYRRQLALGRWLGNITYLLLKRLRTIVRVNLELCFPDLSTEARKKLSKMHFQSLGIGLTELAMTCFLSDKQLQEQLCKQQIQIEGLEYLNALRSRKQGVLILSGHFTSFYLFLRLFNAVCPTHVIYRDQNNRLINQFIQQYFYSKVASSLNRGSLRSILMTLKRGSVVWCAADQDYGANHSVFAPLFSIPTATLATIERYLNRANAAAVTLFYFRLPNHGGYRIVIRPFPAHGDVYQDACSFNEALEAAIRLYPEQFFWVHRRFKTRPKGEKSFY